MVLDWGRLPGRPAGVLLGRPPVAAPGGADRRGVLLGAGRGLLEPAPGRRRSLAAGPRARAGPPPRDDHRLEARPHRATCLANRASTFFGDGTVPAGADMFDPRHVPADLPGDAEEALRFLERSYRHWHDGIAGLDPEGAAPAARASGGPYAEDSMAELSSTSTERSCTTGPRSPCSATCTGQPGRPAATAADPSTLAAQPSSIAGATTPESERPGLDQPQGGTEVPLG
jgi:hypothetical protein